MIEVVGADSRVRPGRVLVASPESVAIEVCEGTEGLSPSRTRVRVLGHGLEAPVAEEMLGRTFDSFARPLDGGPEPLGREWRNVNGAPINPAVRAYPRDFLQTGISAMDGTNTLVRGQKLPIVFASWMPHNRLAAQIVRQAQVPRELFGHLEDLRRSRAEAETALTEAYAELAAACIALGRGTRRVLMGSVTRRLIDLTEVPVLVVK